MKIIRFFVIGIITVYLGSCAVLNLEEGKLQTDPSSLFDLNTSKNPNTSNTDLSSYLTKLSPKVLDSAIQSMINSKVSDSLKWKFLKKMVGNKDSIAVVIKHYESYTDSLRDVFNNDGSVILNSSERFLVDYVVPPKKYDTVYLANLNTTTEKGGNPISFQYDVKKGDEIFFEFENKKKKIIEDITIKEGGEIRYRYSNLKKRQSQVKGSFVVQADNILIVEITNNGFFKSIIKIKILKVPKPEEAVFVNLDSIAENKVIVEEVKDTLYNISENQMFTISPVLDLSAKSEVNFPILITDVEDVIGWGYWIGLEKKDLEKYEQLTENDPSGEPLVSFAKSELNKIRPLTFLPKSNNEWVQLSYKTMHRDTRSLNSDNNFAFFSTSSSQPEKRIEIRIRNKSKLYEYPIVLKTVVVNVASSQIEVEKDVYKKGPFIQIKKPDYD